MGSDSYLTRGSGGVRFLNRCYIRFCGRIIDFTGIQDSPRNVVPQTSTTDIDQAIGFHHPVAAALRQHAGLRVPALGPRIIALK